MDNNVSTSIANTATATSTAATSNSATTAGQAATSNPTNGRRPLWFFIMFIVLISALGSFVNDMFTPALPEMAKFFGTTASTVQLGLTTGMIGLAVGQLLLGPISDHIGRKPVLVVALSFFAVASVVSAFSPTIHFFLLCRFFQGLGASAGYFLGRTIPTDWYQGKQLAKIMSIIGAVNGVAPASAPVFGGVTAEVFGWRGIFIVLAIFAVIIVAISPLVRESLPPERRTKGSIWQTFSKYKNLLHNGKYMTHVAYKGFALGLLFAYMSTAPFILQTHYGLSETTYGLVIGANSVFVVIAALSTTHFKPFKNAAWCGAFILVGAIIAQDISLSTIDNIWSFEICTCLMLLGLGMITTVTNTLAMNEGRAQAGEASSILGISGYVVGATVAPLVGIGDVLHSTAIVYAVLGVIIFILGYFSQRIAPEIP